VGAEGKFWASVRIERMIEELITIRNDLIAGRQIQPITVRTFLSWFGVQRRGSWVVGYINRQLQEIGIETVPDFESAWLDTHINFSLIEGAEPSAPSELSEIRSETDDKISLAGSVITPDATNWVSRDPTYRVSKLQAANQKIVAISPDGTIAQAVTLLMTGGFSQLPVMTNEREVKGIITWRSIGSRMALGNSGKNARDFMETHHEIRWDTSIFSAIPLIVANDYVLVRSADNKISGIITSSDLSIQFRQLSEPFLLISEIENLIRNMIGDRFSVTELAAAQEPGSADKKIQGVADMTFGEYIRLLQNPDRWSQLKLAIDRTIFCETLDRVRKIRNDVTHFDPDGITPQDLEILRDFGAFLKQLEVIAKSSGQ
jgi:CBS domain-containing protein